jgi:antitoxin MazE
MSMQTISKWGNSLAVRIPAVFAETVGLEEGTVVDLKVRAGQLIVIPAESQKYDLKQLVDQITPKNSHRLVDWGKPAGKETW